MKKPVYSLLLFLFVLALNIYYRTFSINFPQLKEQAKDIVEKRIYQEAVLAIDKDFPEFCSVAKQNLIDTFISNYKKEKKQIIEKQIQEEYFKLKDRYQDTNRQTYLMELDCWHWARYVNNVLRFGEPADIVINGKQIDTYMLAPSGSLMAWNNFLYYISASLYKIFSLIRPVPLFTFLFYLPLFFTAIFIIILYLFCYYRWGNICAVISCLFIGLAPIFLLRSCAGWFDTDIFNLLFPLLIVWMYLKSYEVLSFKSRLLWIYFSSFFVGLFCFTWQYWWFIFLIIIIYEIYSLLNIGFAYLQYKTKDSILLKKHFLSLIFFVSFSFLWIIFFSGFEPLLILHSQARGAFILNQPLGLSIWPNVYYTVGELRKADLLDIASSVGDFFLFISSLFSLLTLFLYILRKHKDTTEYRLILILIFWFTSMFFACIKGVRFSMFLLIPLGISLGWALSEIYKYLKNRRINLAVIFVTGIMVIYGLKFILNADSSARKIFPLMNDHWYRVLDTIKKTTPSDVIINSWWDFGNWFKTVSLRRVIFDGQSQNTPQAYWMARVLLSNDEEEAIRILRMLNNGGNLAFEIINKHLQEPFKAILLLNKIIPLEPENAKEVLLKFLPSSVTEEVSRLLFHNPPKAYFIVEYTMQDKISAISFLRNWNFIKAYIAKNINKKGKDKIPDYFINLGLDTQEIERFYKEVALIQAEELNNWLSQWFKFFSRPVKGRKENDLVFFDGGLIYNLKEKTLYLYSPQDNRYKIPKSLFVFKDNKLKETIYPNADLDFSVLFLPDEEGEYQALMLDRALADTLFVRLYFLDGKGLKYFKPFIEEKDGNNYIKVFEIAWN